MFSAVDDIVLHSFALGPQWPTFDPFLFCAHHLDTYPSGNAELGPEASLDGREIGSDFNERDGWRMYHGSRVPGFPQHPHRGFETVTYVRQGLIDHTDSLGSAARFGRGDTQWLTAGSGIVHAEMFPLLNRHDANPLEIFQIWLNLPAANKMVDPYFTMLWGDDTPKQQHCDSQGRAMTATSVVGQLGAQASQPPPPDSWASSAHSEVAIWHLVFDPGAEWTMPPTINPHTVRTIYVFQGAALQIGGATVESGMGAVIRSDNSLTVVSGSERTEAIVLQGLPLREPVARYGPFVMNTEAELKQAFIDYQTSDFGGWPWSTPDPTHDLSGRFARHGDGRVENID